jgi:uncharacterized membrane protein
VRADPDLAVLARAGAGLAMIGASLALATAEVGARWLPAFVRANTLPPRARGQLLLFIGLGAVAGLAVAAVVLWLARRTGGGAGRIERLARLGAPLALAGLVPGLLASDGWPDALTFVIVLSVFMFALEPLWRLHFSAYPVAAGGAAGPWPAWTDRLGARAAALVARVPPRLARAARRFGPAAAVGAAAAGYIAYMAFFAVRNHHRFSTFTWDLAQLDNQFYNFLHGHPFRCTALIREGNWSELRNHAEATVFFLLPIYALRPAAETLLVLQAVLLGAAGVSVYRFAVRRVSRGAALALTGAYYLYPPLHGAQLFDIHFQPLAAAFLLGAIDCFDARRMRLFVVFFVLAIGCREDISVGTAVFGLFLIFTGHRVRAGAVIFAVSLCYFIALRFVIMPAIGPWGFADHYRTLFPEGESSFAGIVKTIVTNPLYTLTTLFSAEKLRYALQILVPLAFLPVRRLHLAMSVLPGAYFTVLTTQYPPTLDIGFQYSGYFIPYIFPAAALAIAALGKEAREGTARRRAAVAALVTATVLATAQWGAIPPRRAFHSAYGPLSFEPPTAQHRQLRRDLHELARMVPKDAILGATDRELPHVSNRLEAWNMSAGFQGTDYIIYTTDHPISTEREQFDAALRAGYERVAERPGLVLIKRPGAPVPGK